MLLWDDLIHRSVVTCPEGGWKPVAIAAAIEAILSQSAREVRRERVGESFEGRPIELLVVGDGPKRVMMWSQMHGDEPTHTTVLLNLLRMLVAEDTPAERVLRGLTLGMILPLNPDGALRNTRQNAQGIDVNRDALGFATAEARAFRNAIESFKPDYGFNLHNQRHRLATGSPPGSASVSLLVPPLDPEDTQTDTVREANRVAATFCERVRARCGGRVSRYDADYMARCFGEWVQRNGVPVILVEAGGWPDGDFKAVEEHHFAAFAQTLDAIAAKALGAPGGIDEADPESYLSLPRSSPYLMFDLLVRGGGVAQLVGDTDEPVVAAAELGVDLPGRKAGVDCRTGGVVAGIGDLHENGGLSTTETPAIVLPGRIVLAEQSPNAFDESPADWAALSAVGATTALVPINLAEADAPEQIAAATRDTPLLNATLVLRWDGPPADDGVVLQRLAIAVGAGAVATLGPLPENLVDACCRLGLPALDPATTPSRSSPTPATVADWLVETRRVADQLGWRERGRIGLNTPADFVLAAPRDNAIAQDCLRSVYVGGTVVRDAGGLTGESPGVWLKWGGPGA